MRRTAKGEYVDFDLLKAKQQMTTKPAPTEVSVRQAIIDRRLRKKTSAMNPTALNTTPAPKPAAPPTPKKAEPVDVVEEDVVEDDVESSDDASAEESVKPRRRQKTKPKQSSGDEDATD